MQVITRQSLAYDFEYYKARATPPPAWPRGFVCATVLSGSSVKHTGGLRNGLRRGRSQRGQVAARRRLPPARQGTSASAPTARTLVCARARACACIRVCVRALTRACWGREGPGWGGEGRGGLACACWCVWVKWGRGVRACVLVRFEQRYSATQGFGCRPDVAPARCTLHRSCRCAPLSRWCAVTLHHHLLRVGCCNHIMARLQRSVPPRRRCSPTTRRSSCAHSSFSCARSDNNPRGRQHPRGRQRASWPAVVVSAAGRELRCGARKGPRAGLCERTPGARQVLKELG